VLWDPPTFDGGTAVLYYRLWFDSATDGSTFSVLASATTETYYVKTGLIEGKTYQFKVEARNVYGYSDYSETISVVASQVPNTPVAPVTTWDQPNDSVIVSWTTPSSGG
jgi:hypothetical protein